MARLSSKLVYSCVLNSLTSVSIVLTSTYVNMLFVSSYPITWLSYFYLAKMIGMLVVILAALPAVQKWPLASALVVLSFSVLLFSIYTVFPLPELYYLAFILCVVFSSLAQIWPMIAWNAIGDVYNVRELKNNISIINSCSSLSVVAVLSLTPSIIKLFGHVAVPIEAILMLILSMITLVGINKLANASATKSKQSPREARSPEPEVTTRPLFIYFAFSVVLFTCSTNLIDFSLKESLSRNFSKAEIGSYSAAIFAMANAFQILLNLFFSKRAISYFGSSITVLITPIVTVMAAPFIVIYPSLFLVAGLFIANNALNYSFHNLGSKLILNAFSKKVANIARFKLKVIADPLGIGLAVLTIWLTAATFGIRGIGVLIALCSAGGVWAAWKIFFYYKKEVQASVNLQRFSPELMEAGEADDLAIGPMVQEALGGGEDAQIYGLSLLLKSDLKEFPPSLHELIVSPNSDLRLETSELLSLRPDHQFETLIWSLFSTEDNDEVVWNYFKYLSALKHNFPDNLIEELAASKRLVNRACAILLLSRKGDEKSSTLARQILDENLINMGSEAVCWNFRVMSFLAPEHNRLAYILDHLDTNVPFKTLKAGLDTLKLYDPEKTIETVARLLQGRKMSPQAFALFTKMSDTGLNYITTLCADGAQLEQQVPFIKALCSINSPQSTQLILELFKQPRPLLRYHLARSLAYNRLLSSYDLIPASDIKGLAFSEVDQMHALRNARQHYEDQAIRAEIDSRLYLSMLRYLYYLAISADAHKILAIASSFHLGGLSGLNSAERARHIELIDLLLGDRELAGTVGTVFEPPSSEVAITINQVSLSDDWLNSFIAAASRGDMKDFYRVAKLRKVKLFSSLPAETLQSIGNAIEQRDALRGDIIVKQGDEADGLYIISTGIFSVEKTGIKILELKEGDFFGELALIDNARRAATVTALEDGVLFYLDRNTFERLCDDLPQILRELARHIAGYLR